MTAASARRSVVVTGVGCASPLGATLDTTWSAAAAGESGIRAITRFDSSEYPVHFAGEVPGEIDLSDVPAKEARRLDRTIVLALGATREALQGSKLQIDDSNRTRVGVAVGSGIGGLETIERGVEALVTSGPRRVQPFMIPMTICNMTSGYIAIRHGIQGLNLCHVSACATGSHAIGEAARAIERGDADAMLAGGTEAPVTRIGVSGFAAMRALSTRNDAPQLASRPFDADRDGFVMGEGAAVLVLEAEQQARARGAPILARVLGYAGTADAANIAQPTEDAEGAQRCMRLALEDADLQPNDVGYLNAHATSTPAGDPTEARAIRAVFGSHADQLPVSATKSMTGHLLGAAGAVEAALCVRSLETGLIPPTINLDQPDPACELLHVANQAMEAKLSVVLSNSFGFGGTNAALIFGRP
ncbi:MAG: beta-ketoacyl-ACP synthase II [Myxococcota bacterium]